MEKSVHSKFYSVEIKEKRQRDRNRERERELMEVALKI